MFYVIILMNELIKIVTKIGSESIKLNPSVPCFADLSFLFIIRASCQAKHTVQSGST